MGDFIARIKDEKKELKDKLDKLSSFLDSEKFNELDKNQQRLLRKQHSAMDEYYNCLVLRLDLLESN